MRIFLLLILVLLQLSNLSARAGNIPENATRSSYSPQGWTCNKGYKQRGTVCEKIKIPEHGILDYTGQNWTCKKGYFKRGNSCQHIADANVSEIKKLIIRESLVGYPGNCPCPYNSDRAGRRCGGRSAYSRAGGYSPLCYEHDVSDEMVDNYRKKYSN